MNPSINCPQARQRCPSPWACGEGCNFNNEAPKQSAQERAATVFWAPDLPVQFVGPEPEDEDKPSVAGTLFLWACGLVALCLLGSLVVPR